MATVSEVGKHPHDPGRASCSTQNATHAEHKVLDRLAAKRWIVDAAAKLSGVGFVQLKHVDATQVVSQKLAQVVPDLLWYHEWLRVGWSLWHMFPQHRLWPVGTADGLGVSLRLAHWWFGLFLAIDKVLGMLDLP